MVASFRIGNSGVQEIQNLMRQTRIEIADFSVTAAHQTILAFKKYGKGQGHQAQLNFGDCISYAMSKTEFMPLLFKCNDFRLTNVNCGHLHTCACLRTFASSQKLSPRSIIAKNIPTGVSPVGYFRGSDGID